MLVTGKTHSFPASVHEQSEEYQRGFGDGVRWMMDITNEERRRSEYEDRMRDWVASGTPHPDTREPIEPVMTFTPPAGGWIQQED